MDRFFQWLTASGEWFASNPTEAIAILTAYCASIGLSLTGIVLMVKTFFMVFANKKFMGKVSIALSGIIDVFSSTLTKKVVDTSSEVITAFKSDNAVLLEEFKKGNIEIQAFMQAVLEAPNQESIQARFEELKEEGIKEFLIQATPIVEELKEDFKEVINEVATVTEGDDENGEGFILY